MAITPYLLYDDVRGALQFLEKAFGFKEIERMDAGNGKIGHAAMKLSKNEVIMMGWPGPKYKNPKKLGQATSMLYIDVKDVETHFKRAKKAGAKVLEKPADTFYGHRRYGVEDPEGHQWFFAQEISKKKK